MSRPFRYGVIAPGADKEDIKFFKPFLTSSGYTTRDEITERSNEFRTADEIHVTAIGHGEMDSRLINNSLTAAELITLTAVELGVDQAKKVTKFRLQACYQGPLVTEANAESGKTKLIPEVVASLQQFGSPSLTFSCPQQFSYIAANGYFDTNATSLEDCKVKQEDGSLERGGVWSVKKEVRCVTAKKGVSRI
jgi:hypothetical protein